MVVLMRLLLLGYVCGSVCGCACQGNGPCAPLTTVCGCLHRTAVHRSCKQKPSDYWFFIVIL